MIRTSAPYSHHARQYVKTTVATTETPAYTISGILAGSVSNGTSENGDTAATINCKMRSRMSGV